MTGADACVFSQVIVSRPLLPPCEVTSSLKRRALASSTSARREHGQVAKGGGDGDGGEPGHPALFHVGSAFPIAKRCLPPRAEWTAPPGNRRAVDLRRVHLSKVSHRSAFRLAPTALLAGSLLLAASHSAGCASQGHSKPGTDGGPDLNLDLDSGGASSGGPVSFGDNCPTGLQSITVSPPTTTVSFTYGQKPPAVTLKASGKFSDGHTMDVTSCAGWMTSPLGTASSGSFNPPGAGQFTVTAGSGTVTGSATVTVKVTGTANPGNVDTSKLDGTPGSGAPTIAYPLDGSLFPFRRAQAVAAASAPARGPPV